MSSTASPRLIYGLTTAVPEGSAGRDQGDAEKYNDVAKTVMGEYPEITVNDLYTVALPHMRERDVHFSDAGSEALGKHVAEVIKAALPRAVSRAA